MAKLEWDKISDRTYEAGLDHGVLYFPPDVMLPTKYDNGVAWNGLRSIDEQFDDGANIPNYFDGVKYLDSYDYGDFSATLSAYTYPDEFLRFEGVDSIGPGLYIDDQQSRMFGMSYRTFVGHAVEGVKVRYRIHLLYNLTVVENARDYQNGSETPQPVDFQWGIYGRPEKINNYRPTAHVILDSEYLDPNLLQTIESILYGVDTIETIVIDGGTPFTAGTGEFDGGLVTLPGDPPIVIDGNILEYAEGSNPRLPDLEELIDLIMTWNPRIIVPETVTGLSPLVPGMGDLTSTSIDGIYAALPGTNLKTTAIDGLYGLDDDV